jgi:hypothetical protein
VTRGSVALALILIASCTGPANGPSPTSTTPTTTTTTFPGNEVSSIFEPGDVLGVIGVESGSSLRLLSFPGQSGEPVFEVSPLEEDLESLGRAWEIEDVAWEWLLVQGHEGYLPRSWLGFIGQPEDVTSQFAPLTSDSLARLGEEIASEIEATKTVLVAQASPLEVVYDVVGLGDDSIAGYRIRVTAREVTGGFAPESVVRSPLCTRGLTATGVCL